MKVNNAVVTPVELNQDVLSTLVKFNPSSKLKEFLVTKTGVEKIYYSLMEVLTLLKEIIRGEGLFDPANPSIILCSPDLEDALNVRAVHVTEIRDLVLLQVTRIPERSLRGGLWIFKMPSEQVLRGKFCQQTDDQQRVVHTLRVIRTVDVSPVLFTDKDAEFTLKPKFLDVVRSVPGVDQTKIIFTYEDITGLLSKYILARKDVIFDPRNIKVALVAEDPIGEAFGVRAFHRCQVNNLLRSQLTPVSSGCSPGVDGLRVDGPPPVVSARERRSLARGARGQDMGPTSLTAPGPRLHRLPVSFETVHRKREKVCKRARLIAETQISVASARDCRRQAREARLDSRLGRIIDDTEGIRKGGGPRSSPAGRR